jgi:tRNA1Val (adenine37-N6)-methyltransferase
VFHFKKFSLDDSTAAMKIGTDAVLLGAWVRCENETRILDIGTGSGILAIMMAQRNSTIAIDAVELNAEAALLAAQNARLSPWANRITILETSIQKFASVNHNKYSLIICNPPFFSNSLKANGEARNMARHNDSLPTGELLAAIPGLLSENGRAAFIFPANDLQKWIDEAARYSMFAVRIARVKSTSGHAAHRVMVLFSGIEVLSVAEEEIAIFDSHRVYSDEYRELTRNFYLQF